MTHRAEARRAGSVRAWSAAATSRVQPHRNVVVAVAGPTASRSQWPVKRHFRSSSLVGSPPSKGQPCRYGRGRWPRPVDHRTPCGSTPPSSSILTSESEWEAACGKAVEDLGGLDVLVNNAGMGDIKSFEDTTLAEWERTVAIDQTGVFLGMKLATHLKRSGHASVLQHQLDFRREWRVRRLIPPRAGGSRSVH